MATTVYGGNMIVVNHGPNPISILSYGGNVSLEPGVPSYIGDEAGQKNAMRYPTILEYKIGSGGKSCKVLAQLPSEPQFLLASIYAMDQIKACYPTAQITVLAPQWIQPYLPEYCSYAQFKPNDRFYREFNMTSSAHPEYFSEPAQKAKLWGELVAASGRLPSIITRMTTWKNPIVQDFDLLIVNGGFSREATQNGLSTEISKIAAKYGVNSIVLGSDDLTDFSTKLPQILRAKYCIATGDSIIPYTMACFGIPTLVFCAERYLYNNAHQYTVFPHVKITYTDESKPASELAQKVFDYFRNNHTPKKAEPKYDSDNQPKRDKKRK